MIDIKVLISNYISTDTYTVNIYKQGSTIAVATKNVAAGAGNTIEFKSLAEGFVYEAEVIHNCSDGSVGKKRITVTVPNVIPCNCPSGFVPNADRTRCVHEDVIAATFVQTATGVGPGPTEAAYCREGIRIYSPGFGIDGRGSLDYASGTTHPYWASHSTTTDGRLNIAGVWNSGSSTDPLNTWIGFSKTVNITATKLYWIAIAGDNYCRIKVNGVVIVDQSKNTVDVSNVNFNYWHCYPVLLNAGSNIIQMECLNTSGIGAFAAEIYDCGIEALKAVTTATEATINRVFTTMGTTEFDNSYTCPDGYALDMTDPMAPVCKKIEYQVCG